MPMLRSVAGGVIGGDLSDGREDVNDSARDQKLRLRDLHHSRSAASFGEGEGVIR